MADESYAALVTQVLQHGVLCPSRAGPTLQTVGATVRVPITSGKNGYQFPLLTRKHISFRNVALELLWFARGETSAKWLEDRGVGIWSADADQVAARGFPEYAAARELGPIYGRQWRDQLPAVIAALIRDPFSRRHVVNSWNFADLPRMALPPCHYSFQFVAQPSAANTPPLLTCVVTMRSGDIGLGIPYNIASYSLLLCLVAQTVKMQPHEVVINIADAHIYESHVAALKQFLGRPVSDPPTLRLPDNMTWSTFAQLGETPETTPGFSDWIVNYQHAGALKLPLQV